MRLCGRASTATRCNPPLAPPLPSTGQSVREAPGSQPCGHRKRNPPSFRGAPIAAGHCFYLPQLLRALSAPPPVVGSPQSQRCPPPTQVTPAPSPSGTSAQKGLSTKLVTVLVGQPQNVGQPPTASSSLSGWACVEYELQETLWRKLTINYAPQSCFN